jgi:hypothetical protein
LEWLMAAVIGYVFLLLALGFVISIRGLPRFLLERNPRKPAARKRDPRLETSVKLTFRRGAR